MEEIDPVTAIIREMDRKPAALLSSCMSEVNSIRNSIMFSERIICLAPLVYSSSFQPHLSEFPGGFSSYVFNPRELPSFLGFAQMTQNTGFLICYLNEHPEALAKAVAQKVRHSDFQYLIKCAIPAVFGYFSSREHLNIAIRFYDMVVEKCDQRCAITILQPLMHSAINFRFIESALSKFLDALVVDVNFLTAEKKDTFFPLYSAFLVRCIIQSLPLLPEPITTLLHKLKDIGWEPENFSFLFFQKFLWKLAFEWLSDSSARNHIDLLKKIIDRTSTDNEQISLIYKGLFNVKSLYEIPSVYVNFGHMYLDFYISVHDIHVIARALHSCKQMPETVTLDELLRVPPSFEFSWYTCQVYPHLSILAPTLTPSSNSNSTSMTKTKTTDFAKCAPLFHGDTHEVKQLERLMGNRLFKSWLSKWKEVVCACEAVAISPFIRDASSSSRGSPTSSLPFMKAFRSLQKSFNKPDLNRKLFLSLIESRIGTWVASGNAKAILSHLDNQFMKLLSAIHEREGLAEFSQISARVHQQSSKAALVDAIRKLICLDSASLYDQFMILIHVMREFKFIAKTETFLGLMYPVLFQQCKGKFFLSTFIKLNYFAMRNQLFLSFCEDEEKVLWLKLESVILFCMNSDEVFLKGYIALQELFSKAATANII